MMYIYDYLGSTVFPATIISVTKLSGVAVFVEKLFLHLTKMKVVEKDILS
jgi:hypothetical protein